MVYFVTGCAGFIGSKVTELLLKDGESVVGVDNLNDAYDVRLKRWRLQQLEKESGFSSMSWTFVINLRYARCSMQTPRMRSSIWLLAPVSAILSKSVDIL